MPQHRDLAGGHTHKHQQPHVPPHLILTATLKDFVCISFTDLESETQIFEGTGQGPQGVIKAQMESVWVPSQSSGPPRFSL